MSADQKNQGFGTRAVHAGQSPDPTTGAVIIPISLSTTFQQASPGVHKGFEYSRTGNPTRLAFEDNVASLEKGEWGVALASGSATTATVTSLWSAGDHIIAMNDLYGGTYRYFTKVATKFGLEFTFLDLTDASLLEPAIKPNTKMLWIESPTNPLLKVVDIKLLSEIAHKHKLLVVVDNTFLTPYCQLPLELGADLVVHSVTKYLNGHSDVVMGIVVGRCPELLQKLRFLQNSIGAVPSAFDSFLAVRGTKTLHVRMDRHCNNAQAVAEFLEKHPRVDKVSYPGLPSHPQYELAKKQMKYSGGIVSFHLKGGIRESRQFMENLSVFALAESLGGVESLADHPAIMTHAAVPLEERQKTGILDNFIRLSCGIEDVEDLIADLSTALGHITDQ